MGTKRDFIVESNGLCFICLRRSETSLQRKRESNISGSPNIPIHSLQRLSRFLKMDMDEVFKSRDDIPPHLLDMVINSTLKAELCEKCSNLIGKFSRLNQQLEKIRMEVMTSLRNIHDRLMGANEEDKIELDKMTQSKRHPMTSANDEWLDKLKVMKILRSQAIAKSAGLIHTSGPRIKVENLSMKEVSLRKLKPKLNRNVDVNALCRQEDEPEIQIGNIKSEYPTESSACEDRDDNSIYYDNEPSSPNICDVELNKVEMKVDVHELRSSHAPTHKQATYHSGNDNVMNADKLTVPKPRKSSKLTGTKVAFNPSKANDKYYCNLCDKQYTTRRAAFGHYHWVHLKTRFICNTCDKEFVTRYAYRGHYLAVNLGGVGLTCSKCNRSFTSKENLKRHQRTGSCADIRLKKRHLCEFCENSYSREDSLKVHIKNVHLKSAQSDDSSHECSQCTKTFKLLRTLKRHIQRVHNTVHRRCNLCPKSCNRKDSLDYHKLTIHALEGRKPR